MSFSEDAMALEQSLRGTRDALRLLLQGLQARRAGWISARPSLLAPSAELEQLTQRIARDEAARADLLARLRSALPALAGHDPGSQHLNVTRIAAALPAPAGRSLRDVGDEVQTLAKAVRTEVTLGQRLVRFAQSARPDAPAAWRRDRAPGYDRGARSVRAERAAGALVDGRV